MQCLSTFLNTPAVFFQDGISMLLYTKRVSEVLPTCELTIIFPACPISPPCVLHLLQKMKALFQAWPYSFQILNYYSSVQRLQCFHCLCAKEGFQVRKKTTQKFHYCLGKAYHLTCTNILCNNSGDRQYKVCKAYGGIYHHQSRTLTSVSWGPQGTVILEKMRMSMVIESLGGEARLRKGTQGREIRKFPFKDDSSSQQTTCQVSRPRFK